MLGGELQRTRQAAGLTQEELADRADIDRTYVSKLERDLQSPTVDVLVQLCRAMRVRASELLALVEDDLKPKPRRKRSV
ncbi:MAG: helix-turn-helix domain-containing protein [Gemmatimonadaceae bacterium]